MIKKNTKKGKIGMYEGLVCPHCNGIQLMSDAFDNFGCCDFCGKYIDDQRLNDLLDWKNMFGEDYYDDYLHTHNLHNYDDSDDYFKNRKKTAGKLLPAPKQHRKEQKFMKEEEVVKTFVIRLVTAFDILSIREGFEQLGADITLIESLSGDTPILNFLKTNDGQKLTKSYKVDTKQLSEYRVELDFIFSDEAEKLEIISTIFKVFDFCIIREEMSTFIVGSNRGIAKGILSENSDDPIEVLSLFLTGYEKYSIMYSWLDYYGPAEMTNAKADDIYIMGAESKLIPFCALTDNKDFPSDFFEFLSGETEIKISSGVGDNGRFFDFHDMLVTVAEATEGETITVCSVRGCDEYCKEEKQGGVANDETEYQPTY